MTSIAEMAPNTRDMLVNINHNGFYAVALNYQTEGRVLQLNRAKFYCNGNCGYILKPACMCEGECLHLIVYFWSLMLYVFLINVFQLQILVTLKPLYIMHYKLVLMHCLCFVMNHALSDLMNNCNHSYNTL